MALDFLIADGVRALRNPSAAAAAEPYGAARSGILCDAGFSAAQREICAWPGYAATPLRDLPALAGALGIAAVHYKDEAERFGLKSFKALGGAYAVYRLLAQAIARTHGGGQVCAADVLAGQWRSVVQGITVTCATDGNHGRSVAWGAVVRLPLRHLHPRRRQRRAPSRDRGPRRRSDPRARQLRRLGAPRRCAGQGPGLDRRQRHDL